MGRCFGIHPLVLEDVLHTGQRPKFEDYGEYVFLVLRMLYRRGDGGPLEDEQVSLVIGPNWVVSFQEREGDVFDPVRERIRSGKGRIRTQGADYLAYSLRDAYDHTIQVMDTVETFRDMIAGMLEVYLSSVSNRMNEIMKVLTIIATVFMPLTFLVGVYGTNFKYLPELEWRWGYFALWGLMMVIAVIMLIYFRRKKWL